MASGSLEPLPFVRVLFCGHDMDMGFQFTKKALSQDTNVEVFRVERQMVGIGSQEAARSTVRTNSLSSRSPGRWRTPMWWFP